MRAVLVQFDTAEKRQIESAARQSGLTQKEFCRQAATDAASAILGNGKSDLRGIVREILRIVRVEGPPAVEPTNTEQADAVAVLIQMGQKPDDARARVQRFLNAHPQAQAAEIIKGTVA